ncbi:DNA (cytosine-5)-methyltransferase 3 [Myotis brandtii]|uniref:ICOS ligand n=1 Tax=Myotis brandtii TaxID=109478 RepID=S7NGF1_MYOBR|nr:DNA (cytosine-5)-methyltransferase 3 [Myotis brandtii]
MAAAPDMDPEAECSMDIILVGSREQSSTPSPEHRRDLIAYEVKVNQRAIEELCICCGSFQVCRQHPLFEGGMCSPCKDKFRDYFFLYDEDGYQSYCCICCAGQTLLICENPDCTRCYCFECVDILVGPGTSGKVQAMSNWVCFLCLPSPRNGLLQRRRKWRERLKAFYDQDPVEEWGPFDLVYGCTPPLRQACDHPPGWYLFQFHRVLQYARPRPSGSQPFFWMFVDNLMLTEDDRVIATRFLETDPVTILDTCGRAVRNAVHVWSNIPAVRSRHSAQVTPEELAQLAQDRQRARAAAPGPATLVKKCFLPLREYFNAGLLLLLLSGLQADSQGKEVRAMVGSDVELSCIYTKEKSLDLNELYVYWQITNASGKVEPVTYYLLGNSSTGHHNNRYKDRAQMSLDSMKQGNFSLRLYNITPQDEQKYDCLVFRKTTERILNVTVTLHVAANYSMPVVIAPTAAPQDEELTFTCTSKDGYPRPNVYWINKTDNSLLDEALQNSTVSLNAQGLYDVVSVLRIRRTPDVNVGCCIENVLLHQNLTVSSQKGSEPIPGTTGSNTDIPGDAEEGRSRTVVAVIALLLTVIVAAAAGWWCRSRCPRRRGYYTGAQAARPERGFTGEFARGLGRKRAGSAGLGSLAAAPSTFATRHERYLVTGPGTGPLCSETPNPSAGTFHRPCRQVLPGGHLLTLELSTHTQGRRASKMRALHLHPASILLPHCPALPPHPYGGLKWVRTLSPY